MAAVKGGCVEFKFRLAERSAIAITEVDANIMSSEVYVNAIISYCVQWLQWTCSY